MIKFHIKKIGFGFLLLFLCGFILLSVHQHYLIKSLIRQNQKWEIDKYQMIQDLNDLNQRMKSWHEFLKGQGTLVSYPLFLKSHYGSDQLSQFQEVQVNFNFSALMPFGRSRFESHFYGIMALQKIRMSSYLKDFLPFLKSKKPQSSFFNNIPSMWPTEGKITSLFGMRNHPIKRKRKFHRGVDIANLTSTDIVSSAPGIVIHAGPHGGHGNTVIIDHNNGFKTLYGHSKTVLVKRGDKVERGTLIAKMGSTGYSTGPHLHYEIHFEGTPLDPLLMIN